MPPPPGGHTLPAGRTQGPEAGEREKEMGWTVSGPAPILSLCSRKCPPSMVAPSRFRGDKEGKKRGLKDPIKRNLPEEGMGIRLQGELPYMIV